MVAGFIHPAIRYQSPSDSGELERCLWFLGPLLSYFAFAVSLPRCLAASLPWRMCGMIATFASMQRPTVTTIFFALVERA